MPALRTGCTFFTEQLQLMRMQLAGRLASSEINGQILERNDLSRYLISGAKPVHEWIQSATDHDDDAFLKLLLALYYHHGYAGLAAGLLILSLMVYPLTPASYGQQGIILAGSLALFFKGTG